MPTIHQLCANSIRFLSVDAVQKANSGHPGAPMGMAEIATVLWKDHLQHNPKNPHWANRDRFVLSNGHASMLLYSLLHLTGYNVTIDDLKQFRQMGAKTAGHPEFGFIEGIETTTGPLGQGIGNAVGFALAERMMASQYNTNDHTIIDHYTYAFLGDGCLMEGISHEACSLAGTLKLNKLIMFYDDNDISIDGPVKGWFTDNTAQRFAAYQWNVIEHVDGHSFEALDKAIIAAKKSDKPTLILCKTIIGKGAPDVEGSASTHGSPLGEKEIAATRKALNWDYPPFVIPKESYEAWNADEKGALAEQNWNILFADYEYKHPELAKDFLRRQHNHLPENFQTLFKNAVIATQEKGESIATRVASQRALNALAIHLSEIVGGSSDLTPSNNTFFDGSYDYDIASGKGNYIRFGVREFGMSTILNGLALYGGFIPYGATFLVFSDYARNAIRMSALMNQRIIYVMTHDSIGLGEDGPTHQPIEHIESLRLIPNLDVWRPCDAVETMVAWGEAILSKTKPSLLALSRQNLAHQQRDQPILNNIAKGGYILKEVTNAKITLLATGSEVALAMDVANELGDIRVISMPCVERFNAQDELYRTSVLDNKPILAIEAGATRGWYQFADRVLGIDTFGDSAPAPEIFKKHGFTKENLTNIIQSMIKGL